MTEQQAVPEELLLGQFIPLHYHAVMLTDQARMGSFKKALEYVVPRGGRVLELGGGTGVLSFFAAQKAARVWCVERNPELVDTARRLLALNSVDDKVEVVQADAYDYLPPERVDVVVCEMLHSGLLREKQAPLMASFKARYLAHFGPPLPTLVPEAAILGLQPVHHSFEFFGYQAPIPVFQDPSQENEASICLAEPAVTHSVIFSEQFSTTIAWDGEVPITRHGSINAIRFITRSILAVRLEEGDTVDWYLQHMLLPLEEPVSVRAGGHVRIAFSYETGAPLKALAATLRVSAIG
jgi:predicted RNA methylase